MGAALLSFALTAAALLVATGVGLVAQAAPPAEAGAAVEWPSYGGDPGGSRYTPLDDIHAGNLSNLEVAWTYRTGDVSNGKGNFRETSAFELTPLVVDGVLFACTPFNRVIALDPETGEERWGFDPSIDLTANHANQFVCRGVATWLDPDRGAEGPCKRRIFTATNDARLFALDAATGARCTDFGEAGEVDLNPGVGEKLWKGRLPAGGQATPMSYRARPGGRQYVVIAAGGHGRGGTRLGDHIVAFALREPERRR
jgi:quinoprotein glucose dehydrogenase